MRSDSRSVRCAMRRSSRGRGRSSASTSTSRSPRAGSPTTRASAPRFPRSSFCVRAVRTLHGVIETPERPLVVVLGGAKVSDKIELIDRFLDLADVLLIGGAMCFSFFRAQGRSTGDSLVEPEGVELARKAMLKAEE